MYCVYILKLRNSKYYIGYTTKLESRLKGHRMGKIQTTKYLNPQLVFYASFKSKLKAIAFEKYLKTSSGFAFRNKRLV